MTLAEAQKLAIIARDSASAEDMVRELNLAFDTYTWMYCPVSGDTSVVPITTKKLPPVGWETPGREL